MIGQFLSTYNWRLYSRWSLVTHSSAPQYCPLASCFWGYFSPHSSPSRWRPQGPHPDFPLPGSSHLVNGKKKTTFGSEKPWECSGFLLPPPPKHATTLSLPFPRGGGYQNSIPSTSQLGGSHSKHFGFEGSRSGRTDLGRFPLMFYITSVSCAHFFSKKK